MTDVHDTPDSHVIDQARRALAEDPRAGILDATISIAGSTLVVGGRAETSAHRDAVTAVLTEALPGWVVANQMTVAEGPVGPTSAEELG